jgi:hypothetical protein
MLRATPLLPLLVLLTACSTRPDYAAPPLSRSQALARTEVLELKVKKVWNTVHDALDHDREPGISHVIEVEVVAGPGAGTPLTLPYDEWNVGKEPPAAGARVVTAPADWVKRAKDTKGRPFGGW